MSNKVENSAQGPATAGASRSSPHCLLCHSRQVAEVDRFPCDQLQEAWALFGVTFSKQTWEPLEAIEAVELFECAACGFKFCDARLAGDGLFYAELERQKAAYYPPEVPEFVRTLAWARERKWRTVLDIGCGEGAFLDLARQAGLSGTGIELNLQAAELCRGKGHTVHTRALSQLLREKSFPAFDLVTLFQVAEHVPDPVQFVTEASQFLAPGGCLSVAVPNERGIYRICPKEPHQWPPHHVTRWRLRDLRRLGEVCNLDVITAGANRLYGREGEHFWKLRNDIGRAIGQRPLPGGQVLPAVLSFFYRKLGLRYVAPAMGTSVYALYQRRAHAHG